MYKWIHHTQQSRAVRSLAPYSAQGLRTFFIMDDDRMCVSLDISFNNQTYFTLVLVYSSVTFRHSENQRVVNKLVTEVKGLNNHFISQHIRKSHKYVYTAKSLTLQQDLARIRAKELLITGHSYTVSVWQKNVQNIKTMAYWPTSIIGNTQLHSFWLIHCGLMTLQLLTIITRPMVLYLSNVVATCTLYFKGAASRSAHVHVFARVYGQ